MNAKLELASGWPQAERAFLEDFYAKHNAVSWEERYAALEKHLAGENSFHAMGGGEVTLAQKVGCLEYELLENHGLALDSLVS